MSEAWCSDTEWVRSPCAGFPDAPRRPSDLYRAHLLGGLVKRRADEVEREACQGERQGVLSREGA
eukprot:scaffold232893_cov30-Tisochrysis_lutea.AAC.2